MAGAVVPEGAGRPTASARGRAPILLPGTIGLLSGCAVQINRLAARPDEVASLSRADLPGWALAALLVAGAIMLAQWAAWRALSWLVPDGSAGPAFRRWDRWTYPVLLLPLLGVAGVHFSLRLNVALYLLTKVLALYAALRSRAAGRATATPEWLSVLFLLSGLAALIYQIAWQRVLFVAFGVDIESVTIIVSAFLLGLGVGSLAGGYLSTFASWPLPRLFLLCELGIGLFGLASIPLIQATAAATRGGGRWSVSLAVFSLLVIPTTFMGATLPILVTHVHRWYRNVGQSVALLYSLNTLGSALASLLTVYLLFAYVGLQTSVTIAAGFNFLVGGLVYRYAKALEPTGAG